MIKEFIPYQQALALKELGFDELCLTYYNYDMKIERSDDWAFGCTLEDKRDRNECLAPLYQQAFRWFREKHKLESIVVPSGNSEGKTNGYYFEIIFDFSKDNIESDSYPSYEEAELACIDKLIKIVKNK